MRFCIPWPTVLAAMAMSVAPFANARDAGQVAATDFLRSVQQADARLIAIEYRLATRNAALCDRLQPATGLQLHALSQYPRTLRSTAREQFGFEAAVAVENVVPGSSAERAGIVAGDSLIAINQTAMPGLDDMPTKQDTGQRDQALMLMASLPVAKPLGMTLLRDGQRREVRLVPQPACRSRIDLVLGSGFDSQADGEVIQIGARFLDEFDDTDLAVIIAHEMAHNILHHRARLEAAGAEMGSATERGSSGRLNRQIEDEADRLSVYLLANAGYDPGLPGRFWRGPGQRIDPGSYRSTIYRSPNGRAALTNAEAAHIRATTPRPIVPVMITLRNAPLR